MLAYLVEVYKRLYQAGRVPDYGYAPQNISFVIVLDAFNPLAIKVVDLRDKNTQNGTRNLFAPRAVTRTSQVSPNFLWDKTSYALGITEGDADRALIEHASFVAKHRRLLSASSDMGHRAVLSFLDQWRPDQIADLVWPMEIRDTNVTFGLVNGSDGYDLVFDREESRWRWRELLDSESTVVASCLLSGKNERIARVHPVIKGVPRAQTSGAALVSFNLDAFSSRGFRQGENAPISEISAFEYSTALNYFLRPESRNRVRIGDLVLVFWSNASDPSISDAQENRFWRILEHKAELNCEDSLEPTSHPLDIAAFDEDNAFVVIALTANAARLVVRFIMKERFAVIIARLLAHADRIAIVPPPPGFVNLSFWRQLAETNPGQGGRVVEPQLAADWINAILNDTVYPVAALTLILQSIRQKQDINALQAGMLKAILVKNLGRLVPLQCCCEYDTIGYTLGRIFALHVAIDENIYREKRVSSLRTKFFPLALAQPRRIFPLIEKHSDRSLAISDAASLYSTRNIRQRRLELVAKVIAAWSEFPNFLAQQSQAEFAIGYFHQRHEVLTIAICEGQD